MPIESSRIDTKIADALRTQELELLKDDSDDEEKSDEKDKEKTEDEKATSALPAKPTLPPELVKKAEEALAKHGARKGTPLGEKVGMFVAGAAICGGGYMMGPGGIWDNVAYVVGGFLVFAGLTVDLQRRRKNAEPKKGILFYPADVLEALLRLLSLSPIEKRYGDLLVLLARDPCPLEDEEQERLIEQINGLLNDHRTLNTRRTEILAGHDASEIAQWETERQRLLQEADATPDAIVREVKKESARMLSERIEDANAVLRVAMRMEAQEEAIYQTMGALHSSLTRLSLAPSRIKLAAPDVNGLRDTIDRTRRQTQAVEQAVQEVLTLRADA
jgi:cell division septum initiation protein DivIVA